MTRTRLRLLAGIAVVAAVLSWSVVRAWTTRAGALPQVPWTAAVVIAVVGASVLGAAVVLRPRLRHVEGHRPVPPLVAARFAVLALASSRAGAALVGLYGGYLLVVVQDLETAYRRGLALAAAACVLASLLLTVAGLVLERVCRLPPDEGADGGVSPPRPNGEAPRAPSRG